MWSLALQECGRRFNQDGCEAVSLDVNSLDAKQRSVVWSLVSQESLDREAEIQPGCENWLLI